MKTSPSQSSEGKAVSASALSGALARLCMAPAGIIANVAANGVKTVNGVSRNHVGGLLLAPHRRIGLTNNARDERVAHKRCVRKHCLPLRSVTWQNAAGALIWLALGCAKHQPSTRTARWAAEANARGGAAKMTPS